MMAGQPFGLALYRAAWAAFGFAAPRLLERRAARGKEDPARKSERMGFATRARPAGVLIWIHGASVGECAAALPLIPRLLGEPGRHALVTSGTITSAALMAERLPQGAFHQFVPIDAPDAVARFLDHWRPDLALFLESELWPNLLSAAHARKIPLALINARFSQRSFRGWSRTRASAGALLSAFNLCLAQDEATAKRLTALGARDVRVVGSLKADAEPLPVDDTALAAFKSAVRDRPIFLAASTHASEEEIVLDAATMIHSQRPDTLVVIVPRHPDRGAEVEALARGRAFKVARRGAKQLPARDTAVYVADTLGELGLFYRAASFAFLGGSLVERGGQNPHEPARLGLAVMTGPYSENFAESFRAILAAQGEGCVHTPAELAALALRLLRDPSDAARLGEAAKAASQAQAGALARTYAALEELLAHARA